MGGANGQRRKEIVVQPMVIFLLCGARALQAGTYGMGTRWVRAQEGEPVDPSCERGYYLSRWQMYSEKAV